MPDDQLAERFEANRPHLRAVALRMLGSPAEADDAVQEAWLRLSRHGDDGVDNLGGWLTTVVGRVCLDMLRARTARREDTGASDLAEVVDLADRVAPVTAARRGDPEHDAVVADSVGLALLLVLDALAPAERIAFVLHDLFDVPFDEIAAILDRSPAAARQLASRGRRRVRRADGTGSPTDRARQREVVDAFLAASRGGDFAALVALLHPDVALDADEAAVAMGAPAQVVGADAVAGTFAGRAQGARPALVAGAVGVAWAVGGRPRVVWDLTIVDGRIIHFDMIAGADELADLDLTLLDD
jgi:RNA polymerase sigma factor (sigma-70 family)